MLKLKYFNPSPFSESIHQRMFRIFDNLQCMLNINKHVAYALLIITKAVQ